jgi:transposase
MRAGESVSSSGSIPRRCAAGSVVQAEIDEGQRPGVTTTDAVRIAALERDNRELRRANAILKSASAFFAAELDRPQR